MLNMLDRPVLEEVLAADPATLTATLDAWGWHGPRLGDAEWACDDPGLSCGRIFALALHYFERRHPEAEWALAAIAAGVVHHHATGCTAPYPVEDHPRFDPADAWLWAFAGGHPAPPGEIVSWTPPLEPGTLRPILPGGPTAFTRAALDVLDALLFENEDRAREVAEAYLAGVATPESARAAAIFSHVSRWGWPSPPEGPLESEIPNQPTASTAGRRALRITIRRVSWGMPCAPTALGRANTEAQRGSNQARRSMGQREGKHD